MHYYLYTQLLTKFLVDVINHYLSLLFFPLHQGPSFFCGNAHFDHIIAWPRSHQNIFAIYPKNPMPDKPKGFVQDYKRRISVCKLKKSFYGLSLSPKKCHKNFDSFMIIQNFTSDYDHSVYFKSLKMAYSLYSIICWQYAYSKQKYAWDQ